MFLSCGNLVAIIRARFISYVSKIKYVTLAIRVPIILDKDKKYLFRVIVISSRNEIIEIFRENEMNSKVYRSSKL